MPYITGEAGKAAERSFRGTSTSSCGNLGQSNVHLHVRAPLRTNSPSLLAERGPVISAFVHDQVVAWGGSISAEHVIGQMKRAELGRLASPAQLHALRSIKAAFDPKGIMNPGKLIPLASEA